MTDSEFDHLHLWHPYTSMHDPLPCYAVERCEGVYIYLEDGTRLIDGMSSWWAAIHGYNNPRLNEAIKQQTDKMSHVMFGGLTHSAAVELGRRLLQLTPKTLQHIFYADSGSISVEVALKMALQYHSVNSRNKIITIEGGYHGDTWHCMSVCDPVGGMHTIWNGRLPQQIFVSRPCTRFGDQWDESGADARQLRDVFKRHSHQVAALILEPVVQGAGGMYFYHPNYLKLARELCDQYDILLICDEVATGFGRTGKMFASEWAGVEPDIMCVGKALTGGYMTMAATLATTKVAMGIKGAFMHGPTFMGNPLACAVAAASLDLIVENDILKRVGEIETILKEELSEIRSFDTVDDVRILGAIGVVQMKNEVDMAAIQAQFVDAGVWIRPFGKLIYVMPQYVITDDQLRDLCCAMVRVVAMQ